MIFITLNFLPILILDSVISMVKYCIKQFRHERCSQDIRGQNNSLDHSPKHNEHVIISKLCTVVLFAVTGMFLSTLGALVLELSVLGLPT